ASIRPYAAPTQPVYAYRPDTPAAQAARDFHAPLFAEEPESIYSVKVEEAPLEPQREEGMPLGLARAQLHETYVVAQTADGIVIVDQHAAHERLVYEKMKTAMENGGIARQPLLIPEVVELDPSEVTRV